MPVNMSAAKLYITLVVPYLRIMQQAVAAAMTSIPKSALWCCPSGGG
jgi:hypothetical protein